MYKRQGFKWHFRPETGEQLISRTECKAIQSGIRQGLYRAETGIPGLRRGRSGTSHPVSYTHLDVYKRQYQDIVFEDTIPTLKRLKAMGLRLAMATSTPREKAMETKELCGFGSFMEIVLCGDMVKESKPNPEIYLKCLEQLGLSGEQCIVDVYKRQYVHAHTCHYRYPHHGFQA